MPKEETKVNEDIIRDNEMLSQMDEVEDDNIKSIIANVIKDDNIKLKAMDKIEDEYCKSSVAKTIQQDEIKLKAIDKIENKYYKVLVAKTIQSDHIKFQIIDNIKDVDSKRELALTIKNIDIKLALINRINDDEFRARVAIEVEDSNIKLEIIDKITNEACIKRVAITIREQDKIIQVINKLTNPLNQLELLSKIENSKERIEILRTIIEKNKDQSYDILEYYKNDDNMSNSQILEEIDEILELYGFTEDEIKEKKQILQKMYEKNWKVLKDLDYRLLRTKYLNRLGEDKINLISCYQIIQEKILKLSDAQLDIWIKCIDNYLQNAGTEEWTIIADAILTNLINDEYKELIQDIEDITNVDINLLTKILQNNNIFDINSKEEIKQYEEIKSTYTNKWIGSNNLGDKRLAVLEKVFGHDTDYAKNILKKYGKDIDLLPESSMKSYVKSIREIMSCNKEELDKIYEECKEVTFVDKTFIERTLKTEYGKLYNEGLLKIENCEKADESEYGENVYLAGTKFKMIIHSVGGFSLISKYSEDYQQDWNRPEIESQYFSTSYIRNDMIGTAPVKDICYGFDEMADDSLVLSSPEDAVSGTANFIPKSSAENEKYYTPDNQINNTCWYNEMVFKRIQNGKKKEPSYIVIFKMNGQIENLEKAKKAQEDWKKAGKDMPIVIIDVDKCLENEKAKVVELLKEYEISKTPELAKEIYYKIKNNRETYEAFCQEIQLEEFERIFKQDIRQNEYVKERKVTEEDLRENYESIPTNQGKMRRILKEIIEIKDGKQIA